MGFVKYLLKNKIRQPLQLQFPFMKNPEKYLRKDYSVVKKTYVVDEFNEWYDRK